MKKTLLFSFLIFWACIQTAKAYDFTPPIPKIDSAISFVIVAKEISEKNASQHLVKDWSRNAEMWVYYANQTQVDVSRFGNYAKNRSEVLFSNDELTVQTIYPNPASSYAFIDYEVRSQFIKAKITIRDVLGSVVNEYSLLQENNKIRVPTENYVEGVYFYTLSINEKTIITKKLVVKHQ